MKVEGMRRAQPPIVQMVCKEAPCAPVVDNILQRAILAHELDVYLRQQALVVGKEAQEGRARQCDDAASRRPCLISSDLLLPTEQ